MAWPAAAAAIVMLGLAAAQVMAAAAAPASAKGSEKGADAQRVAQLMAQLGSQKQPEREAAQKDLIALGEVILPLLTPYRQSDDPEIRLRVGQIIKAMEPPWGEAAGGLQCRLSPGAQKVVLFKGRPGGARVVVTYELRNVTDREVMFLPWYCPLEGVNENIFNVVAPGGEKARYLGKQAERLPPKAENFTWIIRGNTVQRQVELPYDFSTPGVYEVSVSTKAGEEVPDYFFSGDPEKMLDKRYYPVWTGMMVSNTIKVEVTSEGDAPAPPVEADKGTWGEVAGGLQCRLLPETQTIEPLTGKNEAHSVKVAYELRNVSDKAIRFLAWDSPLWGGGSGPIFRVVGPDGKEVPYTGPMASRVPPGPTNFLLVYPGETLRGQAALYNYDFSKPGDYWIVTTQTIPDYYLKYFYGDDAEKMKRNEQNVWSGTITSKDVAVKVVTGQK
jgi:hypothetical protein